MKLNLGKILKSVIPLAGNFVKGPWGAVAGGLLGGLFGGSDEPKMSKEMKQQFAVQQGIQNELLNFARGPALSDPMEQIALANARAQLGVEQGRQRDTLFSQWNPNTDAGNTGDMMLRLTNNQVGQNMNLVNQALLGSMANRRQAFLNASGVANSAANIAGSARAIPGPDLTSLFGNLAQQVSYNNELKRRQQPAPAANNGNTGAQLQMPGVMAGVGTGGGSTSTLNPAPLLGGFRGSFAPGTTDHDKAMFLMGERAKLGGFS